MRLGIVIKIHCGIKQAGGDRTIIDQHVFFIQMPAARAHDKHRRIVVELIMLAVVGSEIDVAVHGIAQIHLSIQHVGPARCAGILAIGHEHFGVGIQRIDDHLAIHRPGDLHAAIEQILRDFGHLPVAITNVLGCCREVGRCTGVETLLILFPRLQNLVYFVAVLPAQLQQKLL